MANTVTYEACSGYFFAWVVVCAFGAFSVIGAVVVIGKIVQFLDRKAHD